MKKSDFEKRVSLIQESITELIEDIEYGIDTEDFLSFLSPLRDISKKTHSLLNSKTHLEMGHKGESPFNSCTK